MISTLRVLAVVGAIIGIAGCAQPLVTDIPQPQLMAAPVAVYSQQEVGAMAQALAKYTTANAKALSAYRPVEDSGSVIAAGVLQGQSYRPGTALLRELGYLSFDAPDVDAWIDPPPAGCIPGRCTFVTHIRTVQTNLIIPVEY